MNTYEEYRALLSRTYMASDRILAELKTSKSKIKTLAQLRVIMELRTAPDDSTPALELAELADMYGPSLSRILKILEKSKLIKRLKCKDDARVSLIKITKKGIKEADKLVCCTPLSRIPF